MDFWTLEATMKKTLEHLQGDLAQVQTWRATPTLVESIQIFVPDRWMSQPISQVATITVLDAQTIKMTPRDKTVLAHIEKGIYDAGSWLTPQNNGDDILVVIPPLTEERRKELAKHVHKLWEDSKIALRNVRQDGRKTISKLKEADEISEDEQKEYEERVDDLSKSYHDQVDAITKEKTESIMTI